jgi:hypothetical protein
MSPEDKAAYTKLCAELRQISERLKEISEGGFCDMEGADANEFAISETLYVSLESAAECVAKTVTFTEAVIQRAEVAS